jgi:NO-binding membrane sensor protein with MHYT domain
MMNPIQIFFIIIAVGAVVCALITIFSQPKNSETKNYRPLAGSILLLIFCAYFFFTSMK